METTLPSSAAAADVSRLSRVDCAWANADSALATSCWAVREPCRAFMQPADALEDGAVVVVLDGAVVVVLDALLVFDEEDGWALGCALAHTLPAWARATLAVVRAASTCC